VFYSIPNCKSTFTTTLKVILNYQIADYLSFNHNYRFEFLKIAMSGVRAAAAGQPWVEK
jgi:hypothetical protein